MSAASEKESKILYFFKRILFEGMKLYLNMPLKTKHTENNENNRRFFLQIFLIASKHPQYIKINIRINELACCTKKTNMF